MSPSACKPADWLEERSDPRGELLRLLHTLTQSVKVRGPALKLEDRLLQTACLWRQAGWPILHQLHRNDVCPDLAGDVLDGQSRE